MTWLRRLRGMVAMSVFWAVLWTIGWTVLGALAFLVGPLVLSRDDYVPLRYVPGILAQGAVLWAVWGAVSGAVFALLLAIAERRRTIADLRMSRVALWGAIGGVVIPLGITAVAGRHGMGQGLLLGVGILGTISALLGALCSTGTLWLVRRGERAPAATPA